MGDRVAQFALWHPRCQADGDRLTCLVDVAPTTDVLLQDGDAKLMAHFADQVGLTQAALVEWSVTGFNTPFYSFDIDENEFEDWMTPAWRVRLVCEAWDRPIPPEPISPVPAWGYDQTWYAHRTPWDWNAYDTIVIALNGREPDLDFLRELDRKVEVETVLYPRPRYAVSQLRISMGRMSLPEEDDAVFDVVTACHRQAMTVHASTSMSLMEQY